MSLLRITIIDVGWGDSILLESKDEDGRMHYGLIDSNDTTHLRSSYIFLKKHFEKNGIGLGKKHLFDFVLLSHEHADHAQGLKPIIREFGTRQFWYPKSLSLSSFSSLVRFANRSSAVVHHEAINSTKILPHFGDVEMEVLWPDHDEIDRNPNNNSVVLLLKLGEASVLFTGDAEEKVWANIGSHIPKNTVFFKVPHHGSENGTFDSANGTPWLKHCPSSALLAISSHIQPFKHPDQRVIDEFSKRKLKFLRTDRDYHISFETDGSQHSVSYTHV